MAVTIDGTAGIGAPAATLTTPLAVASGGTNASSTPTAGGVGYGTGTAHAYSAAGTSGQALISAGSSAPTFGTLGIAGGGTNSTATPTAGGVGYGTGTAHAYTSAGTSGQYLTSAGSGAPTWTTATSNIKSDLSYVDASVTLSSNFGSTQSVLAVGLTATTELVLFRGSTSLHAAVWSTTTNTFGTAVLVSTVSGSSRAVAAVAISATAVLVCSCAASTTTLETVVLSVSGTTITVNTPVSTTLSAGCNFIGGQPYNNYSARLMAFGSSYILSYTSGLTKPAFLAITVSGTVPTVGAELLTVSGGGQPDDCISLPYSASILLSIAGDGTNFYATPISVSGTTLTKGTAASTGSDTVGTLSACMLSSGRAFFIFRNVSSKYAAIVSVSGTTATLNFTATGWSTQTVYAQAIGSQVMLINTTDTTSNINVITDNAGTPVLGTAVTAPSASVVAPLGANATQVFIYSGTNPKVFNYGITGNNAVLSTTVYGYNTPSGISGVSILSSGFDSFYANAQNSVQLITTSYKYATMSGHGNIFVSSYDGASAVQIQQSAYLNATPVNQRSALNTYSSWSVLVNASLLTNLIVRRITLA